MKYVLLAALLLLSRGGAMAGEPDGALVDATPTLVIGTALSGVGT